MSILENINEVLSDLYGEDKEKQIQCVENTLIEEMGLDSITYIKFLIMIENRYNIEFEDDKLAINSFKSIGELCQHIRQIVE